MAALEVIVLAAGEGTRMHSRTPKVLHVLGGRPLLSHVLDLAQSLPGARVNVVYGRAGDRLRDAFASRGIRWVHQADRLGTGHAVAQAMSELPGEGQLLVLYGDVPLLERKTVSALLAHSGGQRVGVLTARVADPTGYGRIVRGAEGQLLEVVEEKDATEEERRIDEVNTGILCAPIGPLRQWVAALTNANASGEYYLTDVFSLAVAEGHEVCSVEAESEQEILGVNDRSQLAHLERIYQRRQARALMLDGVTLRDPDRVDIRGTVTAGQDVSIDVNVLLEGEVVLGDGVSIGANTVVRNAQVEAGTQILENCVLEDVIIGPECRIGPFARLRPGAQLAEAVHIGNFVEVKKSRVGERSKINHLTYVGDSLVGRDVNIGAGTITCNYDGVNKHQTVIGDEAFVGSGVELVAPVTVGKGATVGAGSTIGRDAPAGELTIERARQKTVPHWRRPVKRAD